TGIAREPPEEVSEAGLRGERRPARGSLPGCQGQAGRLCHKSVGKTSHTTMIKWNRVGTGFLRRSLWNDGLESLSHAAKVKARVAPVIASRSPIVECGAVPPGC